MKYDKTVHFENLEVVDIDRDYRSENGSLTNKPIVSVKNNYGVYTDFLEGIKLPPKLKVGDLISGIMDTNTGKVVEVTAIHMHKKAKK